MWQPAWPSLVYGERGSAGLRGGAGPGVSQSQSHTRSVCLVLSVEDGVARSVQQFSLHVTLPPASFVCVYVSACVYVMQRAAALVTVLAAAAGGGTVPGLACRGEAGNTL